MSLFDYSEFPPESGDITVSSSSAQPWQPIQNNLEGTYTLSGLYGKLLLCAIYDILCHYAHKISQRQIHQFLRLISQLRVLSFSHLFTTTHHGVRVTLTTYLVTTLVMVRFCAKLLLCALYDISPQVLSTSNTSIPQTHFSTASPQLQPPVYNNPSWSQGDFNNLSGYNPSHGKILC